MEAELQQQLARLQKGQEDIVRRLDELNGKVNDTIVELGGVPGSLGRDPGRKSIRHRLHDLEDDQSAAGAARAALDAARHLHDAAAEKRFTRREKMTALTFGFLVAAGPFVAPLLYHA